MSRTAEFEGGPLGGNAVQVDLIDGAMPRRYRAPSGATYQLRELRPEQIELRGGDLTMTRSYDFIGRNK